MTAERGPSVEEIAHLMGNSRGPWINVAHAIAALYQPILDENARLKKQVIHRREVAMGVVEVVDERDGEIVTLRADLARKDAALREIDRHITGDFIAPGQIQQVIKAALAPAPPTQARAEGGGDVSREMRTRAEIEADYRDYFGVLCLVSWCSAGKRYGTPLCPTCGRCQRGRLSHCVCAAALPAGPGDTGEGARG